MSGEALSPLGMSDEDFLRMAAPVEQPVEAEVPAAPAVSEEAPAAVVEPTAAVEIPAEVPETPAVEAPAPAPEAVEGQDIPAVEGPKDEKPAPVEVEAGKEKPAETEAPAEAVDYEASFKKIMAPFKANGRMVEVRTPEEAIQLMQMGANYTRKMQDLQPHRKLLLMLQNNGLADEGKLSFLIDLDQKNPEAIKKLIKESGIDPLDIDTNTEPSYKAGSHQVSDAEASFHAKLEDVSSTPTGPETLSIIDKTWDNASKNALWDNPEVMTIINEQRALGIYDRIAAEVDRQKTLGTIPANTPFLQAYKAVGDQLMQSAATAVPGADAQVQSEPKVLATRTLAPKPQVTNGDKADAASPTRTVPGAATPPVNFLAMSDDEFLKTMSGRL